MAFLSLVLEAILFFSKRHGNTGMEVDEVNDGRNENCLSANSHKTMTKKYQCTPMIITKLFNSKLHITFYPVSFV